jgi:SSS family solute:Na+ symporter
MVGKFAPAGLTGLILAGLVAALMSTCSATLNSAATLVTIDFVQPRWPQMTQNQLVWTGRIATLAITLIAASWAPMIRHFQGLWAYLQQVFAFVASPLVATFVLGLWWKRLGSTAAWRGLVCGHVFSALFFVALATGLVQIHFTIIAGIVFASTALFTIAWQRRLAGIDTPSADDPRVRLIDRSALARLPADVRWLSLAILAATAAIVIAFR